MACARWPSVRFAHFIQFLVVIRAAHFIQFVACRFFRDDVIRSFHLFDEIRFVQLVLMLHLF